jgi:hypothetical protein
MASGVAKTVLVINASEMPAGAKLGLTRTAPLAQCVGLAGGAGN